MKSIASSLGRAILGTILCLVTMSSPGWGGGSDDEAPDAHQDNGPSYFGFVKDQNGKPVADGIFPEYRAGVAMWRCGGINPLSACSSLAAHGARAGLSSFTNSIGCARSRSAHCAK